MPEHAHNASWLERIAPYPRLAWRGRWLTGTVEPWRILYDHELVVVQEGECRVTIADTPPARVGPLRRDEHGRPMWQAVFGRDADVLAAMPAVGTHHIFPAGSFIIIPPGIAHMTLVTRGPVVRACIHFDWLADERRPVPVCTVPPERPDPASVCSAPAWVPSGLLHGPVRLNRAVNDLVDTFFRRWGTRRVDERLAARATLLETLVRLLDDSDAAQTSTGPELAHAIKESLDEHVSDPRALPDLLLRHGRSYEHCCRVFAAAFGVPPLRYLIAARIERAKHLLAQPGATVSVVSTSIGYADAAYFSRLFRAQVGISPRAFRERTPGPTRTQRPP
jgi:AraC-like DNA-binding protein